VRQKRIGGGRHRLMDEILSHPAAFFTGGGGPEQFLSNAAHAGGSCFCGVFAVS